MVDLTVSLSGWEIANPVIPASGTFGYGKEFSEYYDINCLGTFSFKGTTLEPRLGNPQPRIAETPCGMLNSVGLENPGARHVVEHELKEMGRWFRGRVIANISGFSVDDYVRAAELFDREDKVGLLEINISCPNVHGGGLAFGGNPKTAAEVTREVKAVAKKPVYMKLSPNTGDIPGIARACRDAGADGLSLINTIPGMRFDLRTRKPILANETGGLSGPAVFPVALRMVYEAARATELPIIGMGGVSSARDVVEMMLAGATAVEIGAANLVDPFACRKILSDLPIVLQELGVTRIRDLTRGGIS